MRELLFMDFPKLYQAYIDMYCQDISSAVNTPVTDEEWEEWYDRKFNIKLEIRYPDYDTERFKSVKRYLATEEQYALICLRWL